MANSNRSVPMEVLSLGPSRTGTSSMAAAFNILGIPAYHGFRSISHPEETVYWERAADAKFFDAAKPLTREEWDVIFNDFGALTDIPTFAVWDELVDIYPEAKVVLVERDVEKWYHSFTEVLLPKLYTPVADFIIAYVNPMLGLRSGAASRKLYGGYFGAESLEHSKQNAKRVYLKHYEDVRAAIPQERLLNYELVSGWEPLCGFLNKPAPGVPFPRVNEQDEYQKRVATATNDILRAAAGAAISYVLAPAVAMGIGLYVYVSSRR